MGNDATKLESAAELKDRLSIIEHLSPLLIDEQTKNNMRTCYDSLAGCRSHFRKLNWYYHKQSQKYFKFIIPENSRILEIGCGDGWLLSSLRPSYGLGIDLSQEMIIKAEEYAVKAKCTNVEFKQADIESVHFNEKFDYVILSDVLGSLLDIHSALVNIRTACTDSTRLVINFHSILWEPLLKIAEKVKLKMPQPRHNWLSDANIENFLNLSGFELVKHEQRLIMPFYFPLLSTIVNKFIAPFPFVNHFCLSRYFVVRLKNNNKKPLSVSIIVPCRNERGNIVNAVKRLPVFGTHQEIIFVDGKSTDGTVEEIRELMNKTSQDVKLFIQNGIGKADAVHLGFSKASGDILMILDADLTMPPELLPRFYDAIADNSGEMVMGSRLVYPMEKQAMRFLNILGNKIFSIFFSWLLNQKITDTLCGTKVILRSNYLKMQKERDYFGEFDPFGDFELIFCAAKCNLKILEIAIRYRERTYGETNIRRFTHGWMLLKMFFFALRKIKLQ